jgi:hypothetical protein
MQGSERSHGKSDSSLSPEERARILEMLTFLQGTGVFGAGFRYTTLSARNDVHQILGTV